MFPVPSTVRELRESSRRPGRYTIGLSDGRVFVVGVATLGEIGATHVAAVLSAAAVTHLDIESRVTALVDRSLASLARSRKTRRELDMRLRRVESDRVLITRALDHLETVGALSDERVAHAEASARLRRGEAPLRVRRALQQKGVIGRLAHEAVSAAIADDGFDEVAACVAAAEKRVRALAKLPADVRARRLRGFLQRRGFSTSVILAALRQQQLSEHMP